MSSPPPADDADSEQPACPRRVPVGADGTRVAHPCRRGVTTMAVVVGIFRDYEQAQASVRDLIASGFSSEAISVVSRQDPARAAEALPDPAPPEADTSGAAIGVGTGALLGGALAAMGLAVPGVGPILAAGPLAAALAGASIGAAA